MLENNETVIGDTPLKPKKNKTTAVTPDSNYSATPEVITKKSITAFGVTNSTQERVKKITNLTPIKSFNFGK